MNPNGPVAEERRLAKSVAVVLLVADFAGTFLFGIEGALAAVREHLDLFGAMVLAFCTSLGGGVVRDLLIGATPPNSIKDWRYAVLAFLGGGTAIVLYRSVTGVSPALMITLDAAGLALFAVAGAAKALSYEINPFIAILLGTITGVGGGTLRDIFLAQVPSVLRADVYATAAMFGAAVFVCGAALKLPPAGAAVLGGIACFALRMVAVTLHWSLPAF